MEFKEIQTIIKNFEKSTLTELEIVKGDFRIHLSKRVDKETTQTTEKEETKEIEEMTAVKSPLVGTFYITDAEGNEFVSPGDYVNEGDTICIIEAMKIMNEITAPKSGVIKEIKLKNGDPVGFDQVLILIE
ncbi:MAG: biotin/lipoyl-containing protein [Bacilli bacterium]|jgi:acetyl-CoA carboxylase biotin carboxyl carrier protein|nr:acetyl-CoA carboxylase, biotin carboxyl carrier protein [Acholeplasmataceae bacterium]